MMTNLEKYNKVFTEIFAVSEEVLNENFGHSEADNWDSVRHLNLVSAIEENFDIMLDTEDILGFISYEAGKEILKKYGITF